MIDTEIYKLKYLVTPDFIYEDKNLSGLQVKISSFIYTYKGNEFYFSNEKLGKMFNVSETSISNAIGVYDYQADEKNERRSQYDLYLLHARHPDYRRGGDHLHIGRRQTGALRGSPWVTYSRSPCGT